MMINLSGQLMSSLAVLNSKDTKHAKSKGQAGNCPDDSTLSFILSSLHKQTHTTSKLKRTTTQMMTKKHGKDNDDGSEWYAKEERRKEDEIKIYWQGEWIVGEHVNDEMK